MSHGHPSIRIMTLARSTCEILGFLGTDKLENTVEDRKRREVRLCGDHKARWGHTSTNAMALCCTAHCARRRGKRKAVAFTLDDARVTSRGVAAP